MHHKRWRSYQLRREYTGVRSWLDRRYDEPTQTHESCNLKLTDAVFICFGFPFLFIKPDSWPKIFTPRDIPQPNRDRLNYGSEGQPLASRFLRHTYWLFTIAYLAVNGFIVIVPLIGPYEDSNGNSLQIKGWYYIVITGFLFLSASLYYLATFAFAFVRSGEGLDHAQLVLQAEQNPEKRASIMSVAGVHPEIIEDEYHDSQYGRRRSIKVIIDSDVG